MLGSLLYLIVAVVMIGFLIFIHELGHYFMARHVGMKVEAFGIGFGKPIYKWMRDGVEWRLNWMPFGGYVKIKGAEEEGDGDPYEVPDSFFGRPPLDRIKVSLAGPLANLVFAVIAFSLLWALGGRVKDYSEFSPKIGWLDTESQLYQAGIRPGDEITHYGNHAYASGKDHLYGPLTADEKLRVRGVQIDYMRGAIRKPFDIEINVYPHPLAIGKDLDTAGILGSADYLIYDDESPLKEGIVRKLTEGSPLHDSGIQNGDRVVWANGEVIFSQAQMGHLINDDRALVTVQRGNKTILRRVPRVRVEELRVTPDFKEELADWQYEAGLQRRNVGQLLAIPYNLTNDVVVEELIDFIDADSQQEAFPEYPYSVLEEPLAVGDRIIAVDGKAIDLAYELIANVQESKVTMIVLRDGAKTEGPTDLTSANTDFVQDVEWDELQKFVNTIGLADAAHSVGNLYLLETITPKKHLDFVEDEEVRNEYSSRLKENQKEIEAIKDPEHRAALQELLAKSEDRLHLGPPYFQDRKIVYNPGPLELFGTVFTEIRRTLSALVTGNLSPKWVTGPVGLIQVVQKNGATSVLEGLFWLGTISLNLGVLNLLPIPVLDGGSICFSLFELITRRRVKPKTMEKFIIPFAVLLLLFFMYLTYNDVGRIIKSLFG